jgi:hypothetical protein
MASIDADDAAAQAERDDRARREHDGGESRGEST